MPVGQPPLPLVRAVEFARAALERLHRRLVPGHVALLEMTAAGWLAQAIHVAADLGIADVLADRPRTAAELSVAVDADEDALHRLLRLLISHGIFARDRRGRYTLTPVARALRADAEVSLRDAVLFFGSPMHREHWTRLGDAVRTGEVVRTGLDGQPFFDYIRHDRALGDLFDNAMTAMNGLTLRPLLSAYDFGRFGTLVDVGGGTGSLLAEILRETPGTRGVLFDLPEVVANAPSVLAAAGVAGRCRVEGGSFFERVPRGGDAYLLKHIVHDWPPDRIAEILGAVRAAMTPEARLLLVELVLPDHDRPHPGKYIDLEMLVNTGGRERGAEEYRELLARSGFTLERVVPTLSPDTVLQARPS